MPVVTGFEVSTFLYGRGGQGFRSMVDEGLLGIQLWADQVRSCGLGVGIICLVFYLNVWSNRPAFSRNISDRMKPATMLEGSIGQR